MVTTSHPIPSKKRGSSSSMSQAMMYIMDPYKTLFSDPDPSSFDLLGENLSIGSEFVRIIHPQHPQNDIQLQVYYSSGYHCIPDSFIATCERLREQYRHHRGLHRVDRGPIAYHIIVSCPDNVMIPDEELHRIGCELLKAFEDYPGIISSHIRPVWDPVQGRLRGVNQHNHIIICAYPERFNGAPHKLDFGHACQRLHEISDQISIDHHLPILVNPDHGRTHNYVLSKGINSDSWVKDLRAHATKALANSTTFESYCEQLAQADWTVKTREDGGLVYLKGEKAILDHHLGREFAPDGIRLYLEDRNRTGRDAALDHVDGLAYVQIPLGGRPHNARVFASVLLSDLENYCSDETVLSYLDPHLTYTLLDENKGKIRTATGRQILDHLGVEELLAESRERYIDNMFALRGTLDPIQQSNEEARLRAKHEEEIQKAYQKRWMFPGSTPQHLTINQLYDLDDSIERQKHRIQQQMQRYSEEHTTSPALRAIYEFQKRNHPSSFSPRPHPQKKKSYDIHRAPDGRQRTLPEFLLLLICSIIIPGFDLKRHSYSHTYTYDPAKGLRDNAELSIDLTRKMDVISLMREEDLYGPVALINAANEAKRTYYQSRDTLADVTARLEAGKELYYAASSYLDTTRQMREFLQCGLSLETIQKEHGDVISRHDAAVRHLTQFAVTNWEDLERIRAEYEDLAALQPQLLKVIGAQYDRHRRFALALETSCLTQMQQELKRHREQEKDRLKQKEKALQRQETAHAPSSAAPQQPIQEAALSLKHERIVTPAPTAADNQQLDQKDKQRQTQHEEPSPAPPVPLIQLTDLEEEERKKKEQAMRVASRSKQNQPSLIGTSNTHTTTEHIDASKGNPAEADKPQGNSVSGGKQGASPLAGKIEVPQKDSIDNIPKVETPPDSPNTPVQSAPKTQVSLSPKDSSLAAVLGGIEANKKQKFQNNQQKTFSKQKPDQKKVDRER